MKVCHHNSHLLQNMTLKASIVITWLLQHEPDDRPTALELSQSPLLPSRLEDEYFKGALKMMSKRLPFFHYHSSY